MNHLLPNFSIQNNIDQLGHALKQQFAPVREFKQWVDQQVVDAWHQFDARTFSRLTNWSAYEITRLNAWENRLDHLLPDFFIQNKIDQLGREIKKQFAPLEEFNQWLEQRGAGAWYQQLASFLYKLPMRAIRNIIRSLYSVVENALYAAVHPLKAAIQLAKALVGLVNELVKPEAWSRIGAGMIGTSYGHALGFGSPFSIIGLGIGWALLLGGLTVGVLKKALEAESGRKIETIGTYVYHELTALPEAMLTSFIISLIIGGIQRSRRNRAEQQAIQQKNQLIKDQANLFIKNQQLPQYSSMQVNKSGQTILRWEGLEGYQLEKINSKLFSKDHFPNAKFFYFTKQHFNFAELNINSPVRELSLNFQGYGAWKWGEKHVTFNRVISLKDFVDHRWENFRDVVIDEFDHVVYS